MIKISKNANINYLAKIVKIADIVPVPDSDNLVMTMIDGNTVVSNKSSISVGDIMVYFPVESKISDWYLKENNLYRDKSMNANHDKAGFFEANGRVRCVKLRGQISAGLLMPYNTLNIPYDESVLNSEFDTIDEKLIVSKYVIRLRDANGPNLKTRKGKIMSKVIENQFRFHIDTPQLAKFINRFKLDTPISITRKVHGTSAISSYVICNVDPGKPVKIANWICNKLIYPIVNPFFKNKGESVPKATDYDYLYSSRRVVKNDRVESGYYSVDIWNYANEIVKPKLIKGMTMYYEIVGYLPDGKMIQKDYPYGMLSPQKTNSFEYGINYDIHVYRITMTNEDGNVVEFNSQMVKQYCEKVGLKSVTELFRGTVKDFLKTPIFIEYVDKVGEGVFRMAKYEKTDEKDMVDILEAINDEDLIKTKFLNKLQSEYLEKIAKDCGPKIPDEGIVVRIESYDLDVYKFKSKSFLLKETLDLDKGEENIEG